MFDTEKMITEIEQQPCLWNISEKSYSDKLMKQKAWQEVAENCFEEWPSLSYEDKGKKLDFLQKKWKSVRDYYMREKKKETEERTGSAAKKKKSCPYFDLLQFLKVTKQRNSNATSENSDNERNVNENKNNDRNVTCNKNNDRNVTGNNISDRNVTGNNISDRNVIGNNNYDKNVIGNSNDEDIDDQFELFDPLLQPLGSTQPASMLSVNQNQPSSSKQTIQENKTHMTNQEFLLKCDKNDEDPNIYFLLSLLPEMSKMTDRQNFEFRMEVMKSLNKVMYQIPD